MGIFVCQDCGAHLDKSEVIDLYEWNDKDSIGWEYECPICGYDNYKEIKLNELEIDN